MNDTVIAELYLEDYSTFHLFSFRRFNVASSSNTTSLTNFVTEKKIIDESPSSSSVVITYVSQIFTSPIAPVIVMIFPPVKSQRDKCDDRAQRERQFDVILRYLYLSQFINDKTVVMISLKFVKFKYWMDSLN